MTIELQEARVSYTIRDSVDTTGLPSPCGSVDTTGLPSPSSSVSSDGIDNDTICSMGTPVASASKDARESTRTVSESFSEQFNTQDDGFKWKGMQKTHYVDKKARETCTGCSKTFKMKRRPRHCRRCGDLYCIKCLQYRRRLNKVAHPDPEGVPRKVCKACYNEDSEILGHHRSLTADFVKDRDLSKYERIVNQRVNSKTQTFWRDQLDISTECRRLLDGFEKNVGRSESKKTMQELRSMVAVPDWQRSQFWQVENVSSQCRQCKKSLGMRKSKRNCKVCSLALCKKCSNKELLIYYADEQDESAQNVGGQKMAKLSLINVIGSPEKEPNISLLLYVCTECKSSILEQQKANQSWYENLRDDSPLGEINTMNTMFDGLTTKISTALRKFEEDGITDNLKKTENNDLAVLGIELGEFYTLFKTLQKVLDRTESQTQRTFIKNFTKAKYDFYMESNHDYRSLCKEEKQRRS